jgi:thiamine-phosphate pyrophosphorylase
MLHKLQYISQGATAKAQLKNMQQALDAGCNWVQLRYKYAGEDELKMIAGKAKDLCTRYSATFIINDHPHIAQEVDADGVHLGLHDMPVAAARKIVGNKIIGGTANTFEDVAQRYQEGCTYVGVGPFRFTVTKEKLSPILGVEGYASILEKLASQNISIPMYAIGGITLGDVETLMQTGVYGIAVSGIITNGADKKQMVQQLNSLLYAKAHHS